MSRQLAKIEPQFGSAYEILGLLAQFFLYQVEVHFPGGVLAMEPDQIRENVATCLKILLSAFGVSLLLQQGA